MSLKSLRAVNAAPADRKNDDIEVLFARAVACHQFGQLAQAKIAYKKVLKKRPNHFDAWRRLGLCEHQMGNSASAERWLRKALSVDPRSAQARCELGILLGVLQRPDEALACFDDLIVTKPDFAEAHFHRGNLLLGLRRFAEAVASFDKAVTIDPQHVNALNNRGNALHELERFADAIMCYDRVLKLKPDCVPAMVNRGAAFKDLRQADKAIAEFDLALAIDPNFTNAWINRGETLIVLRRLDEALASFDRALSINSEIALAWLGRANILMLTGKLADSAAACERALAIEPNSPKALTQLGQYHSLKGDAEAAVACFDRALAIKPDEGAALSYRIFAKDFSIDGTFAAHQAARSEWWRNIGAKISTDRPSQHANDRDPARRIVLGYVSADFRQHSAAYTFRPVLTNHDRTNFEVICYSSSPVEDPVTASFRQVADRWRNVLQWSDDRLVDCIRADKVDILIDLSGHTEGHRLHAFARKPAPIQVTAWGHATGTGMPTIDYLFSDPVSVPPEVRHLFAEQIYDLPCAITIEPPPAELRSAEPPVISNGYVTYGVFNRVSKFSNAVFGVWARILRSDLTSRLLIKDGALNEASIQEMLLQKFAAHDIAPDRICLMGSTSREEHLATYRRVDICLDPFPQGGGVSSWEALHMGVPIVAKLGDAFPKRLASAILSAIGMSDWVAVDDDQYADIALRSSADRLRAIRHALPNLIDQRCGPAAYTRAVEQAYRSMWEKRCGEPQSEPA
jgi:predicted O-linked N-acetylglucosamine transferase (SPINDLY family)